MTALVASVLMLTGCTGGSSRPNASINVAIQDFRITPSLSTIRPGAVALLVHDKGPSTHEFVIVRTDLPSDQLPLRPDGLRVDEDSPQLRRVDELSELDIGDRAQLIISLSPGKYVFFCNLEGHYLGGMHAQLQVVDQGQGEPGA